MALSGSLNTSSYDGRYYQLSWTATQNTNTNKSTVSWELKALGQSGVWYAERTLKVVIAGTTVFSKTDRVERYDGVVQTGTIEIAHNSDGSKSFSASVQAAVYTSAVNCTGSKSFTLDNIARKSTLSVGNGTLGTAQTLTVTRQSTSFTHTITYTCGSVSGTIATKSTSTSISFTPPISLAAQNPTGTSVAITYNIETFNGSTSLGSNTYTKTCAIASSVAPSVSFTVADTEGFYSTYGSYVQGKSRLKIIVTASGKEGSTISSYKVTADGKTYAAAEVETDVINSSGTLPISVTVTDSRGRTATATMDVPVLAYSNPQIIAMSVQRSNASGIPSSSGAYLCVTFSANVTSLNSNNAAKYKVKYKKKTATSYGSEYTVSQYTNDYEVVNGTYVFSADTASSYDIILIAEDSFERVEMNRNGSSVYRLFSALSNGLGWAFGKIAELQNYLEVNFNAMFYKDVTFQGDMHINGNVYVDNYNLFGNKILWTGVEHMDASQVIELNEAISEQRNGIVLIFSGYDYTNNTELDYRWCSFYIPKFLIAAHNYTNHSFTMATSNFTTICSKSVTIDDTTITGSTNNAANGTNNGVTFNNKAYVLRYVFGV